MSMDANFKNYMQQLYVAFTAHDAAQDHRLARYRNIEPDSALFLAIQIRLKQAKQILEIGTSTGYSTLWLADAAKATQGHVDTIEIDDSRIIQAKQHAQHLQLINYIHFYQGDALIFLQNLKQSYDLILLDAERDAYVQYWQYLSQIMHKQGGVLIVDNVLSHANDVADFIKMVEQDNRFVSTTLNIGAGVFMVTFRD
ncbi:MULTISPECIES: O-methyltransferase [unclassified Acinetobacter]|uniref:O-methyltransferase n=1 Tax=unclassified Acinetobacter TaxID=196816 RepID=UPI0015D204DE|nr:MULTISPECIES: class I SAM-dependent methyltransferase [unclassified Acinetobacter]